MHECNLNFYPLVSNVVIGVFFGSWKREHSRKQKNISRTIIKILRGARGGSRLVLGLLEHHANQDLDVIRNT